MKHSCKNFLQEFSGFLNSCSASLPHASASCSAMLRCCCRKRIQFLGRSSCELLHNLQTTNPAFQGGALVSSYTICSQRIQFLGRSSCELLHNLQTTHLFFREELLRAPTQSVDNESSFFRKMANFPFSNQCTIQIFVCLIKM